MTCSIWEIDSSIPSVTDFSVDIVGTDIKTRYADFSTQRNSFLAYATKGEKNKLFIIKRYSVLTSNRCAEKIFLYSKFRIPTGIQIQDMKMSRKRNNQSQLANSGGKGHPLISYMESPYRGQSHAVTRHLNGQHAVEPTLSKPPNVYRHPSLFNHKRPVLQHDDYGPTPGNVCAC